MAHVAVIGAGILGRTCAWYLSEAGHQVSLFEKNASPQEALPASWVGAGMLTPNTELDMPPSLLTDARQSLALWPDFIERLNAQSLFQQKGCWAIAHRQDEGAWQHFIRHIDPAHLDTSAHLPNSLNPQTFQRNGFFPKEASVDGQGLMHHLEDALRQKGVAWLSPCQVTRIDGHRVVYRQANESTEQALNADWVIDCRGTQADADTLAVRGIRGEVIEVHAPDVPFDHLVRLMHPRYSLYIVPRPDKRFVIGATQIDTDDHSPVSVRSALELLSAAYSVHKGFAEARILGLRAACRPTTPDHLPVFKWHADHHLVINGLYRHGFLLAPLYAQRAAQAIERQCSVTAEGVSLNV